MAVMKQVAKKSTSGGIFHKLSAGTRHQQNGLIPVRDSSNVKRSASSSASSGDGSALSNNCGDRLTNGLHDSSERVLANGPGCSNTSRAGTGTDTVHRQTTDRSEPAVTSAGSSHYSAADVQSSSSNVNSKSLKDILLKHGSAATAKPSSSSHTASATVGTASESENDVIIVKADDDDKAKPSVHSLKRPVLPADDKNNDVKKARLDGASGHLVTIDGRDDISRKV